MVEPLHQRAQSVLLGAPLAPVAAGLILGILLDEWLGTGLFIYAGLFLLSAASALAARRRLLPALASLVVGSACVGGMLHRRAEQRIQSSGVALIARDDSRIVRFRGRILDEPRVLANPEYAFSRWSYRGERTAFLLEVSAVETAHGMAETDGRIRVTVNEAVLDLRRGERVEVFGRVYRFRPPANPGSFDWGAFHRRHGVAAGLSCDQRENVARLDHGGEPDRRLTDRLAGRARGLLLADLTTGAEDEASLLQAMILGHRSRLDRQLNDAFIRAGCAHFLAVSGVHVLIVMLLARVALGLMGLGRTGSILGMMAVVVVYAMIAEPRPPILRATIMALLYCLSRLIGRGSANANWISLAAIILLAVKPLTLRDVGFQLSFAAVIGVVHLTPVLAAWGPVGRRLVSGVSRVDAELLDNARRTRQSGTTFGVQPMRFWILGHGSVRWVAALLAVSLAAWLTTLPIIITHFGRFQPWGPLNSVLVFPLVMGVMALGFAKLAVGMMVPGLGPPVTDVLHAVDSFLIGLVDLLAALPGTAQSCAAPPWWVVLAWYAALLCLFRPRPAGDMRAQPDIEPIKPKTDPPSWGYGATVVGWCVLAVSCVGWWIGREGRNELTITVLAVGDGSATVIELPDGRTVLYDAGSARPYDVGRNVVVPFLRHRGISAIDRIYVSHPNLDHYTGIPSIMDELSIGPVVVNRYFHLLSQTGSPSRHLLDLLEAREHRIEVIDSTRTGWAFGGAWFELLWPPQDSADGLSANDSSTVLRVSFGGRSILLTGDIEEAAQRALLAQGGLEADVLILPHHGSVRPSSGAFFEAVGASTAIRSSGERRKHHHGELESLLKPARLLNTADAGAVQVGLSGPSVRIRTTRRTRP